MRYSPFLNARWLTIAFVTGLFACGVTPLLARPEPPAADRLMDPTKPGYQGGHLFFHTDDEPGTPTAPSASEEAFKDFKSGPATFADFCKLHPLAGKPLGQERLTIEVLATEADAPADAPGPGEPTLAMLNEGTLLKQQVFANTQAQTENVLPLDRQSDGSKLPEPAWEGERLFTCLEQTDAGYNLALTFAESRVVNWTKDPASGLMKPQLAQSEVNNEVIVQPNGQWVPVAGGTRETPGDNGGPAHKTQEVIYVRLVKN